MLGWGQLSQLILRTLRLMSSVANEATSTPVQPPPGGHGALSARPTPTQGQPGPSREARATKSQLGRDGRRVWHHRPHNAMPS